MMRSELSLVPAAPIAGSQPPQGLPAADFTDVLAAVAPSSPQTLPAVATAGAIAEPVNLPSPAAAPVKNPLAVSTVPSILVPRQPCRPAVPSPGRALGTLVPTGPTMTEADTAPADDVSEDAPLQAGPITPAVMINPLPAAIPPASAPRIGAAAPVPEQGSLDPANRFPTEALDATRPAALALPRISGPPASEIPAPGAPPILAPPINHMAADHVAAASAQPVPTLPPIPPADITDAALAETWTQEAADLMAEELGKGVVRFRLTPAALGELDVRVAVDNGVARVEFAVSSEAARAALEPVLPRLSQLIEERRADAQPPLSSEAGGRDAEAQDRDMRDRAQQGSRQGHGPPADASPAPASHPRPQRPGDGRLSVFA
jgi:Flagellar hook-length control protein FliK